MKVKSLFSKFRRKKQANSNNADKDNNSNKKKKTKKNQQKKNQKRRLITFGSSSSSSRTHRTDPVDDSDGLYHPEYVPPPSFNLQKLFSYQEEPVVVGETSSSSFRLEEQKDEGVEEVEASVNVVSLYSKDVDIKDNLVVSSPTTTTSTTSNYNNNNNLNHKRSIHNGVSSQLIWMHAALLDDLSDDDIHSSEYHLDDNEKDEDDDPQQQHQQQSLPPLDPTEEPTVVVENGGGDGSSEEDEMVVHHEMVSVVTNPCCTSIPDDADTTTSITHSTTMITTTRTTTTRPSRMTLASLALDSTRASNMYRTYETDFDDFGLVPPPGVDVMDNDEILSNTDHNNRGGAEGSSSSDHGGEHSKDLPLHPLRQQIDNSSSATAEQPLLDLTGDYSLPKKKGVIPLRWPSSSQVTHMTPDSETPLRWDASSEDLTGPVPSEPADESSNDNNVDEMYQDMRQLVLEDDVSALSNNTPPPAIYRNMKAELQAACQHSLRRSQQVVHASGHQRLIDLFHKVFYCHNSSYYSSLHPSESFTGTTITVRTRSVSSNTNKRSPNQDEEEDESDEDTPLPVPPPAPIEDDPDTPGESAGAHPGLIYEPDDSTTDGPDTPGESVGAHLALVYESIYDA